MTLKVVTDHGWPKASDDTDANAFDAFKNERDYIAQSGGSKTTVAAMAWAAREIERMRDIANRSLSLAAAITDPVARNNFRRIAHGEQPGAKSEGQS